MIIYRNGEGRNMVVREGHVEVIGNSAKLEMMWGRLDLT